MFRMSRRMCAFVIRCRTSELNSLTGGELPRGRRQRSEVFHTMVIATPRGRGIPPNRPRKTRGVQGLEVERDIQEFATDYMWNENPASRQNYLICTRAMMKGGWPGTCAKLGVKRQRRLAGMSRWLDGISVRIRHQPYHYRPRTEPEAVGRRRTVTSAFAGLC